MKENNLQFPNIVYLVLLFLSFVGLQKKVCYDDLGCENWGAYATFHRNIKDCDRFRVTTNLAFLWLISVFSYWQGKVPEKNE